MTPVNGSPEKIKEFKDAMRNFFRCKMCHNIPKEHNQLVCFSKCSDLFCNDCIASINMPVKCPKCKCGPLDTDPVSNQMLSEAFRFMTIMTRKIDNQLAHPKYNSCLQLQTVNMINENPNETKNSTSLNEKLKKITDRTTNRPNLTVAVEKANTSLAQSLPEVSVKPEEGHDHITPPKKKKFSTWLSRKVDGMLIRKCENVEIVYQCDEPEGLVLYVEPECADEYRVPPAKKTRVEIPEAVTTIGAVKVKNVGKTPPHPGDVTTETVNPVDTPSKNNATAAGESSVSITPEGQCGTTKQLGLMPTTDKLVITPKSVGNKQKRNKRGETKLITACIKGDLDAVTALLAGGDDVNAQDNAKWTPLHEAAHHGYVDIVEKLLDSGALIDVPGGPSSDTPLHDAVGNDKLEVVKLLLQRGANRTIRNCWGQIPSELTNSEEMKNVLRELVASKPAAAPVASPAARDKPVVVLNDGLAKTDMARLRRVAKKYKWKVARNYSANVTHIITPMKEGLCVPSLNVLRGILHGKWILNKEWVKKCEVDKDSAMLQPETFEALGTTNFGYTKAMERARKNSVGKFPGLFHGCHIFAKPEINSYRVGELELSKDELKNLIQCGEGTFLSREPKPETIPRHESTVPYHADVGGSLAFCSHYILYQMDRNEPRLKYNMKHIKSLPLQWFIDCIERFELVDSSKHIRV